MIRESIFSTAIRALLKSCCTAFGFFLGLFLILTFFSAISSTSTEPDAIYTPEIAPNANNIRTTLSKKAPVILKLNIEGMIGTELLNMNTFQTQLLESREGIFKNNRVKALLLHIQSPGGTVTDADGIYRAIKAYKAQYNVPVYAYIDGLCASGGMYIAAAADKVFASDVSIVGSIGVLSPPFLNFSDLMTKVGVSSLTLTAGKGKDALNPLRPWKPGEQDDIEGIIQTFYTQFVGIITSNRTSVDKDKLINEYGAKVFTSEKAKEIGMIDVADASLNSTMAELKNTIGIEDDYYQVYELQKRNWVAQLMSGSFPLWTGKVTHALDLPTEFDSRFSSQFLYLYRPGN